MKLSDYLDKAAESSTGLYCFNAHQLQEMSGWAKTLESEVEVLQAAEKEQKTPIQQAQEDQIPAKCWGDISKQAVDMMIDVMCSFDHLKRGFYSASETPRRELRECFEQVVLEAIQQASAAER